MKLPSDKLKQIIVSNGYVSESDFNDAVQSSLDLGKTIEDILVFRGLISEDALGKLVAEYLKVPYVDLNRQVIPEQALSLISEKLARTYRMVPFLKENNQLKLAMEDPSDFEALEFARRQTGLQVLPHYATTGGIRKALGQYKRNIKKDFEKVIVENIKGTETEQDLLKAAERLSIVKVLDTIVEYGIAERASDIHIESYSDKVIIRFRIDGILHDIIKLPRGVETSLVARIKILSNLKIDEHRTPQDGRYKYVIDDEVIGLRISIIPGFFGENVVMRLLPETTRPLSLEELGLTGIGLERIKTNMKKPHGMLLVTGPTGSGKTTTLYSILNVLNTVRVKICTIEDPIEYGIRRVSQIQVHPKIGLDFAAGLRSLLRHDPDIIMVGEIRDKETAEIAVHAALTGHLVLSTLHTNDAAGAIPRLLDMGVESYLLASTVNVVLAQRLVRHICQACLKEYLPGKEVLEILVNDFGMNLASQKFYKGQGCPECSNRGYSGRIGVYEVLSVSDNIQKLIGAKADSIKIADLAIKEGMVTMLKDGFNKVSSGLTTIEEILRVIREE